MKRIPEPAENLVPLYMLDILYEYTDADHTISLTKIGEKIKENFGLNPNRRTLRRNMAYLVESDLGIEYTAKTKNTPVQKKNEETGKMEVVRDEETGKPVMETIENWEDYYLHRDFEVSEIRLLIDSLLFSRHIPRKDCVDLAEKLAELAGPYYKSHVGHISTRPDTMPQNPHIFVNIEMLDEAIHNGKKVEFSYLEYGTDMKPHPRKYKNGQPRRYRVSPYQMAAKDGRYYLICNLEYFDDVANYRVDRMADMKILEEEPVRPFDSLKDSGKGNLDMARYMEEHIYMFGQGNTFVKFRIRKSRLSDLIETFGTGITIAEETEEEVTVIAHVNEMGMKQFAQNYAPDVVILEPKSLAEEMIRWAEETLKRYQESE